MPEGNSEPTNESNSDGAAQLDRVISASEKRKLIASSPTATIDIAGVPAACVLDTGAVTSLVSAQFYRSHLATKVGSLQEVGTFVKLVGVNGLAVPVDGYLEAPVEMFGQKFTASF